MTTVDTIAAVATPPGFGGVGVVRVSGPATRSAAAAVLRTVPAPRTASLSWFRDGDGASIDQGIALFFPAPHSFTGEDVLELQGHGGPVVMDLLLRRLMELGIRLARPGEFSERAFLNGKLDLTQAEAIADLIEGGTETAVRLAGRTLRGEFSNRIEALVEDLIRLRTFVEAAMDFPDEEIDFIADSSVRADLDSLLGQLDGVLASARQGRLIREGLNLVIAGPPNAGKSSLLNALSGTETAIVTEIPGTTRDLLREEIQIDGMPLHIVDTAGLRHSDDPVEREGIRRARDQIGRADRVLWVFDDSADPRHASYDDGLLPKQVPTTFVRNKIDVTGTAPGVRETPDGPEVAVSARDGSGLNLLRGHLKSVAGLQDSTQGVFLARRRHLDALNRSREQLNRAKETLLHSWSGELAAEDLRLAQQALGEITGAFSSDDLLGRIFSSFCIGK
jgi:tRNA modification GTPase